MRAMTSNRKLLLLFAVWVSVFPLLGLLLFTNHGPAHRIVPDGEVHHHASGHAAGSIGADRQAMLVEATRHYVADHPEAGEDMKQGKALAPKDALNEELKVQHAKFRVREVTGNEAEIYEVS